MFDLSVVCSAGSECLSLVHSSSSLPQGVINKIGLTHVGCLVHGCFNASILKPKEMTPEMWRDSGLTIGGSLEFEVVQLDADAAGVLLIRGKLDKTW